MVENLNGFKSNPEDRNNNPEDIKIAFIDYETMNPSK